MLDLKTEDIEVVGTAVDGEDAVRKERELDPDLVLLDVRMPGTDGVEAARQICARRKDVKIIMLTTFDDSDLIEQALAAGATGYILKDTPPDRLAEAIRTVHTGDMLLSGAVGVKLRAEVGSAQPTYEAEVLPELRELSLREREVLRLVGEGHDNSRIAEQLYLSEKTVRNYVSHIYDVLGIHNRTQLAFWANRHSI